MRNLRFISFYLLLTMGLASVVFNSCNGDKKDEPTVTPTDPTEPTEPTIPGVGEPTATTDPGVVINGVRWATRNVDKPYTFAAKPEDGGMFYQWNTNVGWSIDPIAPSDGVSTWNNNYKTAINATIWESRNNVCPTGWRIPTRAEYRSLVSAGSKWTVTPANGRIFGTAPNTIFLPAAGSLSTLGGELKLNNAGESNSIWSSTPYNESNACRLWFNDTNTDDDGSYGTRGYSVRCVAE
jgi:uncharacterized protein (TIGR02145 family)